MYKACSRVGCCKRDKSNHICREPLSLLRRRFRWLLRAGSAESALVCISRHVIIIQYFSRISFRARRKRRSRVVKIKSLWMRTPSIAGQSRLVRASRRRPEPAPRVSPPLLGPPLYKSALQESPTQRASSRVGNLAFFENFRIIVENFVEFRALKFTVFFFPVFSSVYLW